MKIIDKDPNIIIPNIHENIYKRAVIISNFNATLGKYLNYCIYKDGLYRFKGIDYNGSNRICIWSDNYNHAESVLQLIINEYNEFNNTVGWSAPKYYILESEEDITEFFKVFTAIGKDFRDEIYSHFRRLHDSH